MKLNKKIKFAITAGFSITALSTYAATICSCSNKHNTLDKLYKVRNLANASMNYEGFYKKLINFTKSSQIKNKNMWKKFVEPYKTHEDIKDLGWRGEFWGKTMRGAVACYKYDNDSELYSILEETVKDMLSAQDNYGRFSTYTVEKELQTWDVWSRKYSMTGMLAFLDICKDSNLKNNIIKALEKHADYLISKIGSESNKIRITDTSNFWLGVNSSSILEPIVNLYEVTGSKKYLDFAKYIIDEGGIKKESGNLIDICKFTNRLPYQYPEQKAYETMSFFEGVYRYALITEDTDLKNVAIKFFNMVDTFEISVTGNAGNYDEKFNNCSQTQIFKANPYGQETCVAVTWMRIQDLLYKTTGQLHYLENIQKTGLNAFLGCVNYYDQYIVDTEHHKGAKIYLPFDSYSPLRANKRGVAIGGVKYFNDTETKYDEYYGCCACISSIAVALLASSSVMKDDSNIYVNNYFNGVINDENTKLTITGDYFRTGKVNISVESSSNKMIKLRMPSWMLWAPNVKVDDEFVSSWSGSYAAPKKALKDIKNISFELPMKIVTTRIGNMLSYSYGDITLAIDEESNPSIANIDQINEADINWNQYSLVDNVEDDLVRISVPYKDGNIIFRSYCSAGKHWNSEKPNLTVFVHASE